MRNKISILLPALAAILFTSCIKEKLEVTYNKQEDFISKYIDTAIGKNAEYTVFHNEGSNRLTLVQGQGEELDADGSLTFYYAGYVFNGSYNASGMFSTNYETAAADAGWELTDPEYEALTINLKDEELVQGLKKGLVGVKAGEECEIIFSGKYGFGKKAIGTIPANSALLYKIWVISITND